MLSAQMLRLIGLGACVLSAMLMIWLLLTGKIWAATLCAEKPVDHADPAK